MYRTRFSGYICHFALIGYIALLAGGAFGQETAWQRVMGDDGFSIAIPSVLAVISETDAKDMLVETTVAKNGKTSKIKRDLRIGSRRFITSAANNSTFSLSTYKVSNGDIGLKYLSNFCSDETKISRFSLNELSAMQCSDSGDAFRVTIILASKERLYMIFAGARDEGDPALQRLLTSIRLGNDAIFKVEKSLTTETELPFRLIGELKDTPFTFDYATDRSVDPSEILNVQTVVAGSNGQIPLRLLLKPRATYTEQARMNAIQGTINLQITFSETGEISKISILSDGLRGGLNQEAVKAARQIRFLPQIENGVPVSVVRVVQYKFSIY